MNKAMIDIFSRYGIGQETLNGCIIASGGGTTAEIYMLGAIHGLIPVQFKMLIGTKKDAGCIEKAAKLDVPRMTVARKDHPNQKSFNEAISTIVQDLGIDILFLAGCNQEIYPMPGVYIINNHPASQDEDGGKGMYDIMVHEHVLKRIADKILRHPHLMNEIHRTCVDHHEVIPRKSGAEGMDVGTSLARVWVDIPPDIIRRLMEDPSDPNNVRERAKELQKQVMKYEYMSILVNALMDVERILDARRHGIKLGGLK